MGERVLRGSRLGAVSYENDRNTDLAPRQSAAYDCPKGHHFTVPFAADAEVPATWECSSCGSTAQLAGAAPPEPKRTKPVRTHMDMLRERRSTADLEEVLKEQLEVLRSTNKRKSA
jgi:ribosomal protein L37AE/L43A